MCKKLNKFDGFLKTVWGEDIFFVHSSPRLGNVVDHRTRAGAGCTFKRKKAIQRRTDNTLATSNPVGTTGTQRETIRRDSELCRFGRNVFTSGLHSTQSQSVPSPFFHDCL